MTLGEKVLGCLIILGIPSAPRPRLNQALKTLSSLGGYLLYNRSVHQSAIDSAVLEEQLKLAREIQEDLIPENHPDIPGYDIFGASVAAKQVGGDFFEYLPFDDGRLGIAIGDVSGKAIPASLLMAMTRALVVAASERSNGPEQVLRDVNVHLSNRITNGRFVTASLLTIDGGDLCYASAGHPPLMLYHADTDSFEDVNADGIAMGIIDQMEFERVMSRMEPGDIAIMYTDGLNEAMDRSRREFGYENIRRVVRESADRSAREIVDALYRAIEDHVDGADLFDDTTVVVIKHTEDSYKDS
jgi:sigma-B regulation protein RsbU (phosphoserine phosphatase)